MKAGRALLPLGMLAFLCMSAFGASYSFPPNPIGEKLWREHFHAHAFSEMLPVVLILGALLLAGVFNFAQHRAKKTSPDNASSYEI